MSSLHDRDQKYIDGWYLDMLEHEQHVVTNLYQEAFAQKDEDVKGVLNATATRLGNIIKSMKDYHNGYKEGRETTIYNMEQQIATLKEEKAALNGQLTTLKEMYEKLAKEYATLKDTTYDLLEKNETLETKLNSIKTDDVPYTLERDALLKRASDLLDLIENKASMMAANVNYVKKLRERSRGEEHPRYNHAIDDELLKSQYMESGKLTEDIVEYWQARTDVTYQGLRERLKLLGVWQYNKDKKKKTN